MTHCISADSRSVHSPSTRTSMFTADDVRDAQHSLHLVPIVSMLEAWRKEDNGPGGRPAVLSFEALVTVMLMLRAEQAPQLVTELANVFYQRLTEEARELLGVAGIRPRATFTQDWKRWYHVTSRCFHRLLDIIDGFPARRQVMNAEERAYQYSLRDDETTAIKRTRLDWFCNALLEMTFQELPADVRDLWEGDISIDQTKVPAVSNRGKRKVARKAGNRYVRETTDALVMEIDADWYAHQPDHRETGDPRAMDFTWGYAASIAISVPPDPAAKGDKARLYPAIAIAMKLSTPVADALAPETLAMLGSIVERGHKPGRVTADRAYFSQLLPDDLLLPVRALGYSPVFDYKVNDLGANGHIGGAIQVEGRPYCPAMPRGLVNATKLRNAGDISADIYKARIEEQRPKWEAKRKGLPDENGSYSVRCPALGVAPGVECPLRKLDPKAAKKARPMAKPPAQHARDRICTQTSVTVHADESTRYLQELRFGSEQWQRVYGYDRSAIELINNVVKDGSHEDLENAKLRATRGLTAAAVFTAFALVSANRRMARAWVRKNTEQAVLRTAPRKKTHTPNGLARYRPRLPMLAADGTITLPGVAA